MNNRIAFENQIYLLKILIKKEYEIFLMKANGILNSENIFPMPSKKAPQYQDRTVKLNIKMPKAENLLFIDEEWRQVNEYFREDTITEDEVDYFQIIERVKLERENRSRMRNKMEIENFKKKRTQYLLQTKNQSETIENIVTKKIENSSTKPIPIQPTNNIIVVKKKDSPTRENKDNKNDIKISGKRTLPEENILHSSEENTNKKFKLQELFNYDSDKE